MDVPRTATHAIMVTPAYMAPEFAEGIPADVRTDIYALGVLTYELATGSRPIRGADFVSTLYNHRYIEPAAPRVVPGGYFFTWGVGSAMFADEHPLGEKDYVHSGMLPGTPRPHAVNRHALTGEFMRVLAGDNTFTPASRGGT